MTSYEKTTNRLHLLKNWLAVCLLDRFKEHSDYILLHAFSCPLILAIAAIFSLHGP